MGNVIKRAPAPEVVKPAGGVSSVVAPMDAATQCRVKGVELSQLQNDVTKKQAEVEACNPADTKRRQIQAKEKEFQAYVKEKNNLVDELREAMSQKLLNIRSLYASMQPVRTYINTLKEESNQLDKVKIEHEQAERTQRRNFLDNGPQDGVSGILGVRTTDDKILLAFWITYGAAVLTVIAVVLQTYGAELSKTQKIQIGVVVLAACYGVAYYGITTYG
jgi:vacuolar-type H+-ATPase subunit I/STV1